MQALRVQVLEPVERLQVDFKMLADALPLKFAGHPCELYAGCVSAALHKAGATSKPQTDSSSSS